ncbi:MAG: DUF2384 domain-containing protein [Thermaceae bacterium]|nr:DUF2384 domain-containing protein [Thermaceae bacterium]
MSFSFESRNAVRFAQAERVGAKVGLSDGALAAFLGISPKTYGRRRRAGALEPGESLRVEMLEQAVRLATEVLGNAERARRWLTQPLVGLGGKAPLELLTSIGGYERVRNSLLRQAYGMF